MRHCPQCGQEIPDSAKKCHYCLTDLTPESLRRRILGLHEYLTLPTAVIALIVALYNPIAQSIRTWLKWDGAHVFGYLLNTDIINTGLDDRAPDKQVDEVTKYEKLLRVALINDGHSLATLASNFVCTGKQDGDSRMVFSFDFYDPKGQLKQFPEIGAEGVGTFVGKLVDGRSYKVSELPVAGPNKCTFAYFDKYGHKSLLLDVTAQNEKELQLLLQ